MTPVPQPRPQHVSRRRGQATRRRLCALGATAVSLFLLNGCAGNVLVELPPGPPDPEGCRTTSAGVCIGVDTAVGDMLGPCPCSNSPVTVSNTPELETALSAAGSGDCISLNDGHYESVALPSGVRIVGASFDGVVLGGLSLASGTGASACRLTVTGPITVESSDALLKYTSITGSNTDGVTLESDGSLTIAGSTISKATRYGIVAVDGGALDISRSVIAENNGPGIWMQCDGDCDCATQPRVSIREVAVRENSLVGVALLGTEAELDTVRIADTTVGANFEAGGGLSIARCSDVTAHGLQVEDNSDFGILVDNSDVSLGGPGASQGLEINRNLRGIWLQNISTKASHFAQIRNATLTGNQGIGIGMAGALGEGSISIADTTISDTAGIALPNLVGGVSAGVICMADGILWLNGVEANLDNVTTSGNGRIGVLIDGPATGSLKNILLTGGDEDGGIAQVNYLGGPQPEIEGTTPPITATEDSSPAGGFVGPDCPGTP
ncbi:MAG: hypothetical protein DRI90_04945 [Deltaproteobacteria bacterium]|nr:MAG: hypothetical protein DRI90_04945 [Deltaproteobacteria bacterium]